MCLRLCLFKGSHLFLIQRLRTSPLTHIKNPCTQDMPRVYIYIYIADNLLSSWENESCFIILSLPSLYFYFYFVCSSWFINIDGHFCCLLYWSYWFVRKSIFVVEYIPIIWWYFFTFIWIMFTYWSYLLLNILIMFIYFLAWTCIFGIFWMFIVLIVELIK